MICTNDETSFSPMNQIVSFYGKFSSALSRDFITDLMSFENNFFIKAKFYLKFKIYNQRSKPKIKVKHFRSISGFVFLKTVRLQAALLKAASREMPLKTLEESPPKHQSR